jgi:regulator of sirC expression with transglutaminase-like and TPR domain
MVLDQYFVRKTKITICITRPYLLFYGRPTTQPKTFRHTGDHMPHATETTSAIFTLLTDAAHDVRELMCEQLDTMTEQQLHQLYDHSHRQPDHVAHAIQRALQNNVWQRLTKRLARWCEAPMSLVDVMYFLCEFAHIDYDPAAIDAQLEDLATRCRQEFIRGGAYDPKTRVNAIAEVLGNRLGFTGNQAEYYNPENSFIDSVLKQRRGVPISLSAIYLLVAQRLEVPLDGIGLPGHFIVGISSDATFWGHDPFRRGRQLSDLDCARMVEQCGHTFDENQLKPVSPRYILVRSLNNLRQVYRRHEDDDRAAAVEHMLQALINTN